MRPLKLKMQAFGPYKDVETLDFSELGSNRLFLIHGTTGAGKTTILDAICYALYGDTSGGERTGVQMRCESADPAMPTEVVFEFGLGSRYYRARREPQQMNAAKRSTATGMVNNAGSVALWEIDDAGGEIAVLGTGVREVAKKIEELIGFSSSQFRQVVVLPQGKFRDLLSAGSDKREEILKQLFRTDQFAAVERALADRAKTVTKRRDELNIQRATILSTVDVTSDEVLEALTAEATTSVSTHKKAAHEAEKAARLATAAFESARAQVQALEDLAAAKLELAALESRLPEIATLKLQAVECQKSLKVQPLLRAAETAAKDLATARTALATAQTHLATAQALEETTAASLNAEQGRNTQRVKARDELRSLEDMQPKLAVWRAVQTRAASAQTELLAAEAAVSATKEQLALAKQAQEQVKSRGDQGREASTQLEKVRAALAQDALRLGQLERLAAAAGELAAAEESSLHAAAAGELARAAFTAAQAEHSRVEAAWRAGRAAALAQSLAAGEPCPVCGSTEHPSPAVAAPEADDAALDAARSALDTARAALDVAVAAAASRESARGSAAAQAKTLERESGTGGSAEELAARIATNQVIADSLQQLALDAGDAAEFDAKAKEDVAAADQALAQAVAAEKAASLEFASASTEATVLAKALPEALRPEGALETATDAALKVRETLELALTQAQSAAQSAKEARISAERDVKAGTDSATAAGEKAAAADAALAAGLAEHGFDDVAACDGAMLSPEDLEATLAQIAAHHDALTATKAQIKQAEKSATALPKDVDVAALELQAQEANEAHTAAVQAHTQATDRLDTLLDVRKRLDQVDADHKKVDEEYAVVGVLAAVANGQGQGAKVSFQRWVLGAYLDDVLHAASKRLLMMSKGRYRLKRAMNTTDRKRASGLDLAVFDTWSNRERPAITLSGGESFLAALALALGLAETVQEQAGGTRLDTVFVDEGFGALDQDALDLAMDALVELKDTGRLVGVISHVQELRQVIDARLEVSGGSGGSHARFVVQ